MRKWIRLFIFLMAFQMEVRVRASADYMEQPASCMKSKETCAVQALKSGFHLLQDSLKLHATAGSTLVRLSAQQWRLVSGALWMEEGPGVEVETLHAKMKATHGEYWVLWKKDQVIVRNMTANLQVVLRDGKTLQVPEGFEFWIGAINSKNKTEYGMLQPVDMKEQLPLWSHLYRGSKEEFIKEVVHLRENWGDLAERSAVLYKAVAEREIASVQEKQRLQAEKVQRQEAERRRVQELYREKVFGR
ncbi:hypothetical protein QJS83_11675 [Bdellovibrio sp. 22V]|uniref:hypothetical protein n=1 Tax=Bdellovibrio TaxID=958 RepID=UPI002542CE6C|nr:hypothetical protein [Bdellovibrio sp. 22V]WII71120.1 hypothetical protein QJS83_11675 [Bdellovibrio sp. 22V]